jgi:glycosyltransferase involved in cell wall biosynthesis
MKIAIDMQGAQSSGSATRGIGRYTRAIVDAIISNRGEHELVLVLNGAFPETEATLRTKYADMIGNENILTWGSMKRASFFPETNELRRKAAEIHREAFIASLSPDVLVVSSFFEGFDDDAVTSRRLASGNYLSCSILYDLIPLINHQLYLSNEEIKKWYLEKLHYLKNFDILFGISESATREAIEYLCIPPEHAVNISTDADSHFRVLELSAEQIQGVREKYKIGNKFVMYTGGIDYRKNIERLIEAYSLIDPSAREDYRLAIVCSIQAETKARLESLAQEHGIKSGEIQFTNYVPEEDLLVLYNICNLFIFPSWHEGFGLPALEAMRCGAAVIGSRRSSIPEIIQLEEALFDPFSVNSIHQLLEKALSDAEFRQILVDNSRVQSGRFSWDESAKKLIKKLELELKTRSVKASNSIHCGRPKLAFVSPLPPQRSGIATYSAELVKHLSIFYDVDLICGGDQASTDASLISHRILTVDELRDNRSSYDRVLYHFGNSAFHSHMFDLLDEIPGIVVLHDFFLSGVLHYIQATFGSTVFDRALFNSHGYKALYSKKNASDIASIIMQYPCNLGVLRNSLGIITHSAYSQKLGHAKYVFPTENWRIIPLLKERKQLISKEAAREKLGIDERSYVVCSFGIVGPTKLSHNLLEAWQLSILSADACCRLYYVGENDQGFYGNQLQAKSDQVKPSSVSITGWVEDDEYELYLAAADIAVQLRTLSRGETSAAILDCMSSGIPVISNANGSIAEIDPEALIMLEDDFQVQDLANTLDDLYYSKDKRVRIATHAYQLINNIHHPFKCTALYRNAIEDFYRNPIITDQYYADKVASLGLEISPAEADLTEISDHYARFMPRQVRARHLLIDVTSILSFTPGGSVGGSFSNFVKDILLCDSDCFHPEPIHRIGENHYVYSREFTKCLLGIEFDELCDEPITIATGDVLFVDASTGTSAMLNNDRLKQFTYAGVRIITDRQVLLNLLNAEFR